MGDRLPFGDGIRSSAFVKEKHKRLSDEAGEARTFITARARSRGTKVPPGQDEGPW
jgi:hypothetical protein